MKKPDEILKWIDQQQPKMVDLAVHWVNINSYSLNFTGLKKMGEVLHHSFSKLEGEIQWMEVPPFSKINDKGEKEMIAVHPVLSVSKRPEAKKQFLCVGHMDTVYPLESSFQEAKKIDEDKITGPGITDMKGGLIVMLKSLEAMEQSSMSKDFGWKVLINADEEIGSPSSGELLQKEARNFDIGLVFEPCLDNGNLVCARKGSGNFMLIVRGKSAHAGRDYDKGINAIDALASCISTMSNLSHQREGLTVNFGKIEGGIAHNVVPDLAIGSFNVRVRAMDDQSFVEDQIHLMNRKFNRAQELESTFIKRSGILKDMRDARRNELTQISNLEADIEAKITEREEEKQKLET